jgi:hypothetical protein
MNHEPADLDGDSDSIAIDIVLLEENKSASDRELATKI